MGSFVVNGLAGGEKSGLIHRSKPSPWLKLGLTLGLLSCASGCRVPAPSPEQVWKYGFGDPRSAFESFVTAVQGEELAREYECFSTSFLRRNGLSNAIYGEFRAEMLEEYPMLRYGLFRSEVEEIVILDERHARLRARIRAAAGAVKLTLTVFLVREDYYEIVQDGGDEIPATGYGPPEEFDWVRDGFVRVGTRDGRAWLWTASELDRELSEDQLPRIDSITFAREWRVDDFSVE